MFYRQKENHDGFAFALGGAATVGVFVPVPVVMNNRISKPLAQPGKGEDECPDSPKDAGESRQLNPWDRLFWSAQH